MDNRILPTPEQLRQLLTYDANTGKLTWKRRPSEMFATPRAYGLWNTRFAHKEAFTSVKGSGYRHGKIFSKLHLAHRVIWAMQSGEWPKDQVDHIDTDRLNNSWSNLRLASHHQNARNQSFRSNNKSGFKGVHWCKRGRVFIAQISVNWKKIHLGCYTSAEEAYSAYCEASKMYHGEFSRTE